VDWVVLVPMRATPGGKTRLANASPGPDAHTRLVAAIRADTLAAVNASAGVRAAVAVVDTAAAAGPELVAEVFVQTAPGLNAALREAAAWATSRWPDAGLAALVGDLPALRSDELAAALDEAARHPRAFAADADGTGTTLLTARPDARLVPRFGAGSARRHAACATELDVGPGLRADVDTVADLHAAARLGVGPATAAELDAAAASSPGAGIIET
jgi:2-phospho-L-lactate guanylyltransferase